MPTIAKSEVITPKTLSSEERGQLIDALYAVHNQIFDGVERESFAKYVVESKADHTWIQVHKDEAGAIVGYFAFHIFEKQFNGETTAVFRAEAGLLRAYRGGNTNSRFGLAVALRYMLKHPGRKIFYLGSLVHPSSYSLFTKYCGDVWPRRGLETPPELLGFMDELANEFGLERVTPANPLVRHVGWKTRETETEREYWQSCDKPDARYFMESNPGYVEGHGLVTVVPVSVSILLNMARVIGERRLRKPVEAVVAMARRLPLGGRLLRAEAVRQLKASPLFTHFDDASLKALAARAEVLTLPAGRYVFRKGDMSDELYLLARGSAFVLDEEGGREQVVNQLGSGVVFGEVAMLAGESRSASIRTASASTVVRIPRSVLLPMMEANASLRDGVWSTFAERRFDDLARGMDRYGHLDRKARRAWFHRGEHRELAARQMLTLEPGCQLFVLSGAVELHHPAQRMVSRGSMLLEVDGPLRLVAQANTRLVVLPQAEARPVARTATA